MSHIINAIYEDGVFKPIEPVEVKEHERVEIKIVSCDDWQKRFNRVIQKIHKKATQYSGEEIEADIILSMKEVKGFDCKRMSNSHLITYSNKQ